MEEADQPAIIAPERGKRVSGVIEFRTEQWAQVYSRRIDDTVAALKKDSPVSIPDAALAAQVKAQRAAGQFTVPTTMAEEKAANPFLRAGDVARLAAIRSAKDSFR